jgi:23S rRNA (cytidine1920-2'-O)/16S rRNA (cytidine1409-2'-O)-methyltransferase
MKKQRLDVLVYERGLAPSREMAQRYIQAGEISVDGERRTKPGMRVPVDADITLKEAARFVSRGGLKLLSALEAFDISVAGKVCADVGASTGGFTDCLLQFGATKVYALDVGYGQLAVKLRNDPRVIVMERVNVRHLAQLDEPVSIVVVDVSFISLQLVLPVIQQWLTPQADVIPLIKPQFEAGKADVGKGGIIKDHDVHRRVLEEILGFAAAQGFGVEAVIQSGIKGSKGNVEFLAWLSRGREKPAVSHTILIEPLIAALVTDEEKDPPD